MDERLPREGRKSIEGRKETNKGKDDHLKEGRLPTRLPRKIIKERKEVNQGKEER